MDIIWKYAVSIGSVAVALIVSYSRLVVSQLHTLKCQINREVLINRGVRKIPKFDKWGGSK